MKKWPFILLVLVDLSALVSYAQVSNTDKEKTPVITSIERTGSPGEVVVIQGSGFGKYKDESYVAFGNKRAEILDKIEGESATKEWSDLEIKAIIPLDVELGEVNATVSNGEIKKISAGFSIRIRPREYVGEALRLKKSGASDAFIASHLHHLATRDTRLEPTDVFGNIDLTAEEVVRLKGAGFQDDFIANFEGHPQHLSIGVSAIWLKETHDLVAAPILRVFLVPRSFYKKPKDWWRKCKEESEYCYWPAGLFDVDKWDLNFGITPRTKTDGETSEEKMYVLVGLSNQLNLSALLNVGLAMVPKDIKGEQTQFYFGLTVDSNILKSLGIVN